MYSFKLIGAQLTPFETTNIWEHVSALMELLGSNVAF